MGMRGAILGLILAATILLASPAFGAAGGTPGKISADQVEFDLTANIMTAKGNVWISCGDVEIRGDEVEVNLKTGELVAHGNVKVRQDGEEATGERLSYNLKAREGKLTSGKAVLSGGELKGELYVTGKEFIGAPKKIRVVGGSITSCDRDDPHYHIAAGEIEVYIDDRIVMRNVAYYEGRIPIFYWPYFVISLREENTFTLPRVGYSREGGWFVKTAYNYYRNPAFRGLVYLDYFEKWGPGLGIKHLYEAGSFGTGYLYAYRLGGFGGGYSETDLELSHNLKMRGVEARLVLGHEERKDSLGSTVSRYGSLNLDSSAWRFYVKGSRQEGATEGEELEARGELMKQIPGGPAISVSSEYYNGHFSDWGHDGYWNYRARVHQALGPIDAELKLERFTKPRKKDGDETSNEEEEEIPWNALNRLPEVTLRSNTFRIGSLPVDLQASLLWGRYEEKGVHYAGPDLLEAQKTGATIDAALPILRSVGSGATLTARGGVTLDSYTTGDVRALAKSELGMTMPLASGLDLRLDYTYTGVWGTTPFLFDEVDPSEELGAKLVLKRGKVEAEVGSGYDFLAAVPLDVAGRLRVRFDERRSFEGSISLDPVSFAPREATAKVAFTPSETASFKFGARYDFETGALMRLESEANLKLSRDWRTSWGIVYGGTVPKIQRVDVGITRDLHCREVSLMYSHNTGQIWLEYRIKAFPFEGFKFGVGKEGVLFETPQE